MQRTRDCRELCRHCSRRSHYVDTCDQTKEDRASRWLEVSCCGDPFHNSVSSTDISAKKGDRAESAELDLCGMAAINFGFSHVLSLHLEIYVDCTPPADRVALFYFLHTIRIIQPFLRIELNVSPLVMLARELHEPFEWNSNCEECFENILTQLCLLTGANRIVRIYP